VHLITLGFDDGFLKSNLKIAELYEKHGLVQIAAVRILAAARALARVAR
jgi:hypothetical protein